MLVPVTPPASSQVQLKVAVRDGNLNHLGYSLFGQRSPAQPSMKDDARGVDYRTQAGPRGLIHLSQNLFGKGRKIELVLSGELGRQEPLPFLIYQGPNYLEEKVRVATFPDRDKG